MILGCGPKYWKELLVIRAFRVVTRLRSSYSWIDATDVEFCRRHSSCICKKNGREEKKTSWCLKVASRLREVKFFHLPVVRRSNRQRCRSFIRWAYSTSLCRFESIVVGRMSVDCRSSSTFISKRLYTVDYSRSLRPVLYLTVTLTSDFDCILSLWLAVFFPFVIY